MMIRQAHQFNEHHPELKGFSQYFFDEIAPILYARENDRKKAIVKATQYSVLIAVVVVAFWVFSKWANFSKDAYLYSAMIGGGLIVGMFGWQFRSLESFTKEKIVGGICSYVGWAFVAEPRQPILEQWSSLMLIKKGYEAGKINNNRNVWVEDEISGEAHGAVFKSVEVRLTRSSGDDDVTDFGGQLMSITFPREFTGRTVVLRNKGFLKGKKKGDMKRVGLVDPVFEKIFEAYGTDQVEARYLLTPVFMQTLVDLENSINGKNIRFGFDKNQLFIAVETDDQYEAGSMFKPLIDPARTQKILDEIGAVYDMVDIVSRAKRG